MTPNYFENKAFELIELVRAINLRKHKPMQVGSLGIFRTRGSLTTKIATEERGSAVTLIQTSEPGAPAEQQTPPKRTVRLARAPQIKREALITAAELRDLRAYGSETAQATLEQIRDEYLMDLGDSVDVTHEHMLFGALTGVLKDADGTTLLDYFDFFGETQESEFDLNLDSSTEGEVTGIVRGIVRTCINNLGADGALVDHVHCYASPETMDALVKSKDFRESYKFDGPSSMLREGTVFRPILWQDVIWEEYRLGNSGFSGGAWLAANKAIFFPVGPAIYDLHFAPGDFLDAIDAPGLPMYARAATDPEMNRWLKLHVQSNPLPIVTRPKCLLKAKTT